MGRDADRTPTRSSPWQTGGTGFLMRACAVLAEVGGCAKPRRDMTQAQIAAVFMIDARIRRTWTARYLAQGVSGLRARGGQGRKPARPAGRSARRSKWPRGRTDSKAPPRKSQASAGRVGGRRVQGACGRRPPNAPARGSPRACGAGMSCPGCGTDVRGPPARSSCKLRAISPPPPRSHDPSTCRPSNSPRLGVNEAGYLVAECFYGLGR